MKSSYDRVVKGLTTSKFEVELLQDPDGRYYVRYRHLYDREDQFSEYVTDFSTASYMFDLKIQEMEGN